MAPGGKKKNSNRRTGDNLPDDRKGLKTNPPVCKIVDDQHLSNNPVEDVTNQNNHEGKKYTKRAISSNWQKYEETPCDPHVDTMRGKDFEVLLNYSGGSGSQLQLQEEKEWDETNIDVDSVVLDIKDLKHIVKSIAFHKQINIPEYIFSKDQLSGFETSAKSWRVSYKPRMENAILEKAATKKTVVEPEILDSNLNIIENCEDESIEDITPKSVTLEKKTENIIESLASCLSLKSNSVEKVSNSTVEAKKTEAHLPDDLDFLLSLNATLKNLPQEEKPSETKKTNVDDWLNSILDD